MPQQERDYRGRVMPTIGIAYSGGGIKAAAHGGVMKVFEEYGIPVHMVAGTSAGAAFAALYACGYNARQIHELFSEIPMEMIIKLRINRQGLMLGKEYEELVRICTHDRNIEDLPMPLSIVAVDLISWKKVVLTDGNIAKAVRASSSLPGAVAPVKYRDMLLADGYLLDNCPGDVLREDGADVVIGIDLFYEAHHEPKGVHEVIGRSMEIMSRQCQKIDADYILQPLQESITFFDKKKFQECHDMGKQCAYEHIDQIVKLIEAKTVELNKE